LRRCVSRMRPHLLPSRKEFSVFSQLSPAPLFRICVYLRDCFNRDINANGFIAQRISSHVLTLLCGTVT
jgi:hypothetical protein